MRLHLELPRELGPGPGPGPGAAGEAGEVTPWGPFREVRQADGGALFVADRTPQRVVIQAGALTSVEGDPDPAGLIRRALAETGGERPAGQPALRTVLLGDSQRTTALGWPVRVVHAALVAGAAGPGEGGGGGEPGRVVEHRLCALYRFFSYGCVALLRVADVALFEQHRQALLELLLTGRPDWSGGPVAALSELYR